MSKRQDRTVFRRRNKLAVYYYGLIRWETKTFIILNHLIVRNAVNNYRVVNGLKVHGSLNYDCKQRSRTEGLTVRYTQLHTVTEKEINVTILRECVQHEVEKTRKSLYSE